MARRKKVLAAVMGAIVLAALLGLNYRERNSYECAVCHSRRHVFQWRLGFWPSTSVPLSRRREQIDDSALYRDFFATGHEHDWEFAQGSPYYFFGTSWGGCALGSGGDRNEFCQWYEMAPEFRQFIADKVARGELPRDTVVQLAALPPWYHEDPSADTEKASLTSLAKSLLEEGGR